MDIKRTLAVSTAALTVALGAGHLVQSNPLDAVGSTAVAAALPSEITPLAATVEADAAVLIGPVTPEGWMPRDNVMPAAPKIVVARAGQIDLPTTAPVIPVLATEPEVAKPQPAEAPVAAIAATEAPAATHSAPPAASCKVTLDVIAAPGAMLDAMLVAPCAGNERVVLRHGGLTVTARTSASGTAFIAIPALTTDGTVSVLLPGAETVSAAAEVDLSTISRTVIMWQAGDAFQLSAYERGAAFGSAGHVRAANPLAEGTMTMLGDGSVDTPLFAQIYTHPGSDVPVEIGIEAEVTAATCGHEILGELLESRGGSVVPTEITLAMPGCDAIGDVLVLNNPSPGTTLAAASE